MRFRPLLKIALLLGAIALIVSLLGGCEQGPGTLGPGGPPRSRAIPCVDDGEDHYGEGEPVAVLDWESKPYLGSHVPENPSLSISESASKVRLVVDWDDSVVEGAWYGIIVYYQQPRSNTSGFIIDGPEIRTTDVSCYAIEADRGFLYSFAVQIRAFGVDYRGREIRVGSYWVDIEA